MLLTEEGPLSKLAPQAVLGGLVTTAAFFICWLCGKDPWGGASLSLHSLQSAAIGALLALPLAGLRSWSWTRGAHKQLPALEEVHRSMLDSAAPWLAGLGPTHVAALVALETLPLLFLLLPAAQGGVEASLDWYHAVARATAMPFGAAGTANSVLLPGLPDGVGTAVALLATASLAGMARCVELSVDAEQYEAVRQAVENADRYYRVMVTDSLGSKPEDAEAASTAFKAVALSWITSTEEASLLAGVMMATDVLYLGMAWYCTGDLTAAAVAALVAGAVDYHHLYALVEAKAAKAAAHSSGRGRDGGDGGGSGGHSRHGGGGGQRAG